MGIDVTFRREPARMGRRLFFLFFPILLFVYETLKKKTERERNNRRVLINELFPTIDSSILLFSAPKGVRQNRRKLLSPFECLIPFE